MFYFSTPSQPLGWLMPLSLISHGRQCCTFVSVLYEIDSKMRLSHNRQWRLIYCCWVLFFSSFIFHYLGHLFLCKSDKNQPRVSVPGAAFCALSRAVRMCDYVHSTTKSGQRKSCLSVMYQKRLIKGCVRLYTCNVSLPWQFVTWLLPCLNVCD